MSTKIVLVLSLVFLMPTDFLEVQSQHATAVAQVPNKAVKDDNAKRFFELFFGELYVERNPIKAFSLYGALDSEEARSLGDRAFFDSVPDGLENDEALRLRAYVWLYEVGRTYLALGLYRVKEDSELPYASEFESLVQNVEFECGFDRPSVNFTGLSKASISRRLQEIERFSTALQRAIAKSIQKEIYDQNMAALISSNTIIKKELDGRTVFVLAVNKTVPKFYFGATKVGNSLKIVTIGNDG